MAEGQPPTWIEKRFGYEPLGISLACSARMDQQRHDTERRLLVSRWSFEDPWEDPAHLADPNVGNPDAEPGEDSPDQRPITDNKAGG